MKRFLNLVNHNESLESSKNESYASSLSLKHQKSDAIDTLNTAIDSFIDMKYLKVNLKANVKEIFERKCYV